MSTHSVERENVCHGYGQSGAIELICSSFFFAFFDRWDEHEHSFHDNKSGIRVICTPCQHFTGRSLTDHYKTLWASWVIESIPRTEGAKSAKVFFGGDTGYRYVPKGADENAMPHCPAFKEIGDRIGPFDLSMVPIGAYSPRW